MDLECAKGICDSDLPDSYWGPTGPTLVLWRQEHAKMMASVTWWCNRMPWFRMSASYYKRRGQLRSTRSLRARDSRNRNCTNKTMAMLGHFGISAKCMDILVQYLSSELMKCRLLGRKSDVSVRRQSLKHWRNEAMAHEGAQTSSAPTSLRVLSISHLKCYPLLIPSVYRSNHLTRATPGHGSGHWNSRRVSLVISCLRA